MIFNQNQPPQVIGIPLNWVADYFDGTSLSEYDFNTHKPNDFYSIRQKEVYRFGLIGNRMKFYFETVDGHFHINGKRVEISYIDENNNTFNLTNNPYPKDLITYKQAFTDFNKNKIQQKTNIESISFGYKTMINKHDTQLFFQPIVTLPFHQSAYLELKLTSNRDMKGQLIFYVRGKEVERFDAPLDANISGKINWTIKV